MTELLEVSSLGLLADPTPKTFMMSGDLGRGWNHLQGVLKLNNITIGPRCWLGGGALVRAYYGELQKGDLDLWFPSDGARIEMRNDLRMWADLQDDTEFATSLSHRRTGMKLQLCKQHWPTPQACAADFDFSICQMVWDGDKIYCGPYTRQDLYDRQIRVLNVGSQTWKRLHDYSHRGFKVDLVTAQSICGILAPKAPEWES